MCVHVCVLAGMCSCSIPACLAIKVVGLITDHWLCIGFVLG